MANKILSYWIILIFTVFFCGYNVNTQNIKNIENVYKTDLESTTWITDHILGLDPNIKKYNLTKFTQRKFAGNLTDFSNKTNYTSKYVAPCGNDYFTTVIGKYKFLGENIISISVDSVTYHGEWKKPTEHRKPKELIFSISKIENKIILTKQKSN